MAGFSIIIGILLFKNSLAIKKCVCEGVAIIAPSKLYLDILSAENLIKDFFTILLLTKTATKLNFFNFFIYLKYFLPNLP